MVPEIRTQQVTNMFFLDPRVKCAQAQDSVEEFGALCMMAPLSRQIVAAA